MDKRYSVNPMHFKRMTTAEMRAEFLIEELFVADKVKYVYSHVDRMVTLGAMPVNGAVALEQDMKVGKEFGVDFFLERREMGLFNVGGAGSVTVDGETYKMGYKDCLYIAMDSKDVTFASDDAEDPAKFYMVSAPAHCRYETKLITIDEAEKRELGTFDSCNRRVINQFIHPAVLKTCQLSMGMTALKAGNVWNTMPAHTHERRMEVYFYFELPEDEAVFHMMGEADETRHIVMHNEQAVISPSWSIHSGAGTCAYTFIWAMGGENQTFDDMDNIGIGELR